MADKSVRLRWPLTELGSEKATAEAPSMTHKQRGREREEARERERVRERVCEREREGGNMGGSSKDGVVGPLGRLNLGEFGAVTSPWSDVGAIGGPYTFQASGCVRVDRISESEAG